MGRSVNDIVKTRAQELEARAGLVCTRANPWPNMNISEAQAMADTPRRTARASSSSTSFKSKRLLHPALGMLEPYHGCYNGTVFLLHVLLKED
eukprot:scaffold85504_cov35-Tisochrysis_lutea.AAC.1